MSKDSEDLLSYLDLFDMSKMSKRKSKAGSRKRPPLRHRSLICLTLPKVVYKKLEDCLFICSSSQHLGKLANKNVHSEPLRNLDWFEWEDKRNCWKHQLLLKQDQFISLFKRHESSLLPPRSLHFLSSLQLTVILTCSLGWMHVFGIYKFPFILKDGKWCRHLACNFPRCFSFFGWNLVIVTWMWKYLCWGAFYLFKKCFYLPKKTRLLCQSLDA